MPSGGVDEFAVGSACVELARDTVPLEFPACEFAGGRATPAVLPSGVGNSAD